MYLIDANILMTAADYHYPGDVAPGFWTQILDLLAAGDAQVPRSVYKELIAYQAKWVTSWTKNNITGDFILEEDLVQIQKLAEIADWVTNIRQPPFKASNRDHFLNGADPRIIAAAAVTDATIVTYEKRAGGTTSQKAKIPDIAEHFRVPCITPVEMLRASKRQI